MPHDHPASPEHKHPMWLYIVIVVLVAALAVWGIAAYRGHHASARATKKAEQLQQSLEAAGLPTYASTDQVARLLGTDGGAMCDTSGKDLSDALLKLQLVNGAGGPAQRPVTVAKETLQGGLLIVQTYCPDRLDKYKDFLDDLDYDDVVRQ